MTRRFSKEDRQAAANRIAEIDDGKLSPESVVRDAKKRSSPLHKFFEWDDSKAAHEHRIYQARELIRSITVFSSSTEIEIKAPKYVHDPRVEGQGYIELAKVRNDRDHAHEVMLQELGRVKAALSRANEIAKVLGLEGDIAELIVAATSIEDRLSL